MISIKIINKQFLVTISFLLGLCLYSQDLEIKNYVVGLSPQERTSFFDIVNDVSNMEDSEQVNFINSGIQNPNYYFGWSSNYYQDSLIGSYHRSYVAESGYVDKIYFLKYFLDNDGDNYPTNNNYMYFYYTRTSHFCPACNNGHGSVLINTNKELGITNNSLNTTINDVYGNDFNLVNKISSYSYSGQTWVRNDFGFDCNDNTQSLPSDVKMYYNDYDGDGHGNSRITKIKLIGCPTEISGNLASVPNNTDCNDRNETVTNQPSNWYVDRDQDGFGDPTDFITLCNPSSLDGNFQLYVSNSDDCDDTNSQYNNEQIIWYADSDGDGFGDEYDTTIASCPPPGYIRNCFFDECPDLAGTRENGCPIESYNFDNNNKNYIYERTYINPFQTEQLNTATTNDVIEQITYMDGLGRTTQKNNIGFSPLGKDIIVHTEYDGNGIQNKQYLPYVSTNSSGLYDENALTNTENYYNTDEFDHTTNPYIENIKDNSPLQKTLEIALPGEAWKVNNGHTLKSIEAPYYATDEVRKYNVTFTPTTGNGIAQPTITYDCDEEYYQDHTLIKTTVKDQNWSNTQGNLKDNTRDLFTDKFGRTVLERKFNSQAETPNHDTYYVYNEVSGNLMYVLPPKAVDILEGGTGKIASYQFQKQLAWTDIAEVDKELAYEYQKALKELKDETLKEGVLIDKYGGQGNVSIIVDVNNEVTVNLNITLLEPMPLKTGLITELKTEKPIKDQVVGELFGVDYHYQLYIQKNALFIKGKGKTANLNISFYTTPPPPNCDLDQEILNNLCYQYKYNYENKLVEKKLPGKGWEYIVYNKIGQAVLTQNASQRINNEWSFVKYDALGRVAYTGISKSYYSGHGTGIQQMIFNSSTQYETRTSTPNTIGITGNTTDIYYTNNVNYSESGEIEILTVNYYDDYIDIPTNVTAPPNDVNGVPISTNTKNLPTVSKIRVLDTNDWITKVSYYDDKARLIFAADHNPYLEAANNLKISINFRGQVKATEVNHFKNQQAVINIKDKFTYDKIGRILKQDESINNNLAETIFENQYNELGKLVSKGVGNKVGLSRLQEVNFSYNILGMLKSMNDVTNLGNDLFAYEINYNNPNNDNATKMYNGNISEVRWKSASNTTAIKSYTYSYDALNRIKGAEYYNSANQDEDFGLNEISYDKNGNIYSLERTGTVNTTNYDIIDDLSYVYDANSNKLIGVNDEAGVSGFKDGTNAGNDYIYDLDGKLISDANKNITQITYNHLNQPKSIFFEDLTSGDVIGKIEYVYNAIGQKMAKKVTKSNVGIVPVTNVTEYAGGFNYGYNVENGMLPKLNYISQSEGFIEKDNSGNFNYVYQFKDHLGNIRLSYSDTNNDGVIATTEIREEHGYYPFGLKHDDYSVVTGVAHPNKFNGKELEQALGLDMYEMDFRLYDQTLGRFMVIDPLAEFYGQISISPYAFARNNPISLNDPSGLCAGCGDSGPPNHNGRGDYDIYRDDDTGIVYQWSRNNAQAMMRTGTWEVNQELTDQHAFYLEEEAEKMAQETEANEFRETVNNPSLESKPSSSEDSRIGYSIKYEKKIKQIHSFNSGVGDKFSSKISVGTKVSKTKFININMKISKDGVTEKLGLKLTAFNTSVSLSLSNLNRSGGITIGASRNGKGTSTGISLEDGITSSLTQTVGNNYITSSVSFRPGLVSVGIIFVAVNPELWPVFFRAAPRLIPTF